MHLTTRRSFLTTTATAFGAATLLRPSMKAQSARAPRQKNGFRIFACDWIMGISCDPAVFPMAARIGLDGVQVEFGKTPEADGSLPLFAEAKQDQILEAAAKHSVAVSSLALGAANRIPYKTTPEAEKWAVAAIPVMQRMKIRVVLLPFFNKGDLLDDDAGIEEVIRRLRKLGPRAQDAGVVFGLESWLKIPELERILDAVRSPAIQVYYDVGNMQKVGEDYAAAIRRLGRERICEVHLKDQDDLYGKGSMNFPAVRSALDAIDYRGWVGIEGLKLPLGIEPSIRYDLDYLRPIFPRAIG